MKAWKDADLSQLRKISGVCLDIDDTLSTKGKLTEAAYSALWRLFEAGFAVVPITGRPAGWCDHFVRFWPVHAVIGENGAFIFFMKNSVRQRMNHPASRAADPRMTELKQAILKRFSHAKWASDQAYREYDLAVDLCEDVPPWPESEVDELLLLCKSLGAHAKLSSIHVNIWFGNYDKLSGFQYWQKEGLCGWSGREIAHDEWLYIGDSPNDEPLFAGFSRSVGVANLNQYLDRLQSPPVWMTQSPSGSGFVEMVDRLISSKQII